MTEQHEQLDTEEEYDEQLFPDNNCPEYVNAMNFCDCSNEQILRFDVGRFVDLKIKQSSFLANEKGLFADCEIPNGIYLIFTLSDTIVAYYWGKFMTESKVNSTYDNKKIVANRLLHIDINPRYQYIDGDTKCAGTYINDPNGSNKQANVIFDSTDPSTLKKNEMDRLVPIKTIRDILSGEELLVEYGDLFFTKSDNATEITQIKVK